MCRMTAQSWSPPTKTDIHYRSLRSPGHRGVVRTFALSWTIGSRCFVEATRPWIGLVGQAQSSGGHSSAPQPNTRTGPDSPTEHTHRPRFPNRTHAEHNIAMIRISFTCVRLGCYRVTVRSAGKPPSHRTFGWENRLALVEKLGGCRENAPI